MMPASNMHGLKFLIDGSISICGLWSNGQLSWP